MFLEPPISLTTPCSPYSDKKGLNCEVEDLVKIIQLDTFIEVIKPEDLEHQNPITEIKKVSCLKCCRLCWQIYKKTTTFYQWKNNHTWDYTAYIKILANRLDECHCIAYLKEIEVLIDELSRWSEKKQTKVECAKCGLRYQETIYTNHYDLSFSHTFERLAD
jgi:hypothetical protein